MIRRPPRSTLFPYTTLFRSLPPWLQATDRLLVPLNASFEPTKEFARALIPGVKQLDPTIGTALPWLRSEEHTSELQSRLHLVCRLLLEKKKDSPYGRQSISA